MRAYQPSRPLRGPPRRGPRPSPCSSSSSAPSASEDAPAAPPAALPCDPELEVLLSLLPPSLRAALDASLLARGALLELVLDLGRVPLARFAAGDVALSAHPLSRPQLDASLSLCGPFGADNRAGLDRTLHRVSALRNRSGAVVGLTARVGRSVAGCAALIADLALAGESILLLGRPGVGKTTAIRELSRILADEGGRRVVIVDTSNEIGGDGDVPHPAVGGARRMQVPSPENQHAVLIEAVENHMPQVIVVDEIGTELEVSAARTIAQRGVQLVATAHGHELANLLKNPCLVGLLGGVESVTLGDDEAKRRGSPTKSVLERQGPPAFGVAVEMLGVGRWRVHPDVGAAVDALLAGATPATQLRTAHGGGAAAAAAAGAGGAYPPALQQQQTQQQQAQQTQGQMQAAAQAQLRAGGPVRYQFAQPAGAAASAPASGGRRAAFAAAGQQQPLPPRAAAAAAAQALGAPPWQGAQRSMLSRLEAEQAREQHQHGAWDGAEGGEGGDGYDGGDGPGAGPSSSSAAAAAAAVAAAAAAAQPPPLRLFVHGVDGPALCRAAAALRLSERLAVTASLDEADAVLALRARLGRAGADDWLRLTCRTRGIPLYAIKTDASSQLVRALKTILGLGDGRGGGGGGAGGGGADAGGDPARRAAAAALSATAAVEADALEEARLAVERLVIPCAVSVDLLPRPAHVRAAQIALLAGTYRLACELLGTGTPAARLRVLPTYLQPGERV